MIQYIISAGIGLAVFVLLYILVPFFKSNKDETGLAKFRTALSVASEMVYAIEQEFKNKRPEKLEGMTEEEYKILIDEYNERKKVSCRESIKDIMKEFDLTIPSNAVLDKTIEIAVGLMNFVKNRGQKTQDA